MHGHAKHGEPRKAENNKSRILVPVRIIIIIIIIIIMILVPVRRTPLSIESRS